MLDNEIEAKTHKRLFQNLDEWSFDVFAVNEAGEGHALKYVGYELLQRYDLINKLKVSSNASRSHMLSS